MGERRVRKRGKTWEWSFEGARIGGKRKPISKSGYRTKALALAAGTQAKAEYDSGGRVFTPSTMSVSDYLDYWYNRYVKQQAYRTQLSYESHIRLHIKPYLGRYRLSALAPDIIQGWVDDVLYAEKNLSYQSITCILATLSGSLNYAVHPCQYIKQNPCSYVKMPNIPVDLERKKHMEYVCIGEDWKAVTNFLLDAYPYYYLTILADYHTGMRIGELLAIDLLSDYDPEARTLAVNHQIQYIEKVWRYINPKYDSFRILKIDSILQRAIEKEIEERKENMLRYGPYYLKTYCLPDNSIAQFPASSNVPPTYREIWPIGVRENGKMINPEDAKRVSRLVKKKIGLKYFHLHSLRHTHGTILAENGASPKTVMERLGHKNISVTLQRYVFNTAKMQQDSVELFEKAVQ